jgi:hypothetical protein
MVRSLLPMLRAAALAAVVLASGSAAAKSRKKGNVKFHADWARHPSAQHSAMTGAQCLAELDRRGIGYAVEKSSPGVLAPVRLTSDVGGVVYRTAAPAKERETGPHDVFDCRLVLSLAEWSKILAAHHIDEVLMYSAWRPPPPSWPEGKLGTRHPGALAIDAYRFGKKLAPGKKAKDREWLDVARDFSGRIGAPSCGPGALPPRSAAGKELRAIVCAAADAHLFTTILTPNYDRAHFNHLHLEVTPEVKWHLVR